jgi:hypothetical protein
VGNENTPLTRRNKHDKYHTIGKQQRIVLRGTLFASIEGLNIMPCLFFCRQINFVTASLRRMTMKKGMFFLIVGLCIFALASHGNASIITFDYGYSFSNPDMPSGEPPWLQAVFNDNDTIGSVTLTLKATNLALGEFVEKWYFNSSLPVQSTYPVSYDENHFKADGINSGNFDIFINSLRLIQGGSQEIILTGNGITAFTFNVLNGNNNGQFYAAAHVQGLPPDGEGSAWITGGPGEGMGAPVPIPPTVWLLGAGLVGLIGMRRKFRK